MLMNAFKMAVRLPTTMRSSLLLLVRPRSATAIVTFLLALTWYILFAHIPSSEHLFKLPSRRNYNHGNLHLTSAQCHDAFPKFDTEVNRALSQGPFDVKFYNTRLNGRIVNGSISILSSPRKVDLSDDMQENQLAALHQLHRAVVTSPQPLPNTIFSLSIQDLPKQASLVYARPAVQLPRHSFPMPHFSFWSWPTPYIHSLPAAAAKIAAIEAATPFAAKDPRPVWRGTAWFNNGAGRRPRLRFDLIKMAGGATWADVQAVNWTSERLEASNLLSIDDFCRYKYIVYTEGLGYSGRLQFHQLCKSVLLSPPVEWIQHSSHLIRPVFSSSLLSADAGRTGAPDEGWPQDYPASEANYVFVSPDWSDLEATVNWLEQNPDVAEGIAERQRQTFSEMGHLSPAAETCYWRALIQGWSQVAQPLGPEWDQDGVPFEEFVIKIGP